jgi:hypothetical protein
MKAYQKIALRVAGIFFGIWLLLALAIADFRPLVSTRNGSSDALITLG